jgi:sulfoxide reductase catalytic subunit YedY
MAPLNFPVWLRAAHILNVLFLSLLARSGLEILSAHPKFYWRDNTRPGAEWLSLAKTPPPPDGLLTSRDAEAGFPSWIALPGHRALGLGRHWHFACVAAWILIGMVYVILLFAFDEWRRLIPTSWTVFPDAWHALRTYLSLKLPPPERGLPYNGLQQLSYALVVFVLAPPASRRARRTAAAARRDAARVQDGQVPAGD